MEEQGDYINYPQTPWYEEKENWLYISGGVLLVILLVVGSIWFVRSRSAARQAAVEEARIVEETRDQLNGDLAACEGARDVEACREDEVRLAAVQARSVEMCASLSGEANIACVTGVAVERGSLESCDVLTDPAFCHDRVQFALAKAERDYGRCARISDEALRGSCEGQLVGSALTQGSCSDTHLSEEACLIMKIRRQAIETGDVTLCDRMPTVAAAYECVSDVGDSDLDRDTLGAVDETERGTDPNKADTDDDGLSDADEVNGSSDPLNPDTDGDGLPDGEEVLLWATDPLNPDTDDDGFGDLEEVSNGYNPIGEGKIE